MFHLVFRNIFSQNWPPQTTTTCRQVTVSKILSSEGTNKVIFGSFLPDLTHEDPLEISIWGTELEQFGLVQTCLMKTAPSMNLIFPQQRKLMGSSAQKSSGVCRRGSQEQVPEEGSGRFRRVPACAGAGSGGRFRKVPESSGVCWCRFRRRVPEGSGGFRRMLV